QGGKLLALARALAAAHAVNVFADNVVARIGAPGTQVAELVLGVLAFVLSRHPRINRNAHDCLAGVGGDRIIKDAQKTILFCISRADGISRGTSMTVKAKKS